MSTTIQIANKDLVPAAEAVVRLKMWMKPGLTALRLAQLSSVLHPAAQIAYAAQVALETEYRDKPDQQAEYGAKLKEMMEEKISVNLPFLLTEKHVEAFERDRRAGNDSDPLPAVDFNWLDPLLAPM